MLLAQKFSSVLQTSGTKSAFRYLSKATNFKDAYTYIQRGSYWLQSEIQHQRKVGILMTNCPHFWYSFFMITNTRNTAIPMDPALTDVVIADRIKALGIEVLIISDDQIERTRKLIHDNSLPNLKVLEIEKRRFGEYDTTYRLPVAQANAKDTEVILILPTSGHAGKVRFVPITHKMVEAAHLALRGAYRLSGNDQVFTFQMSYANPFVFFHGGLIPLLTGAGLVIWDNPALDVMVPELLEAKASRFVMKPNLIHDILVNVKNLNFKIPFLRSITIPKGDVSEETRQLLKDDFNEAKVLKVYGQTETCWAVSMTNFEEPEAPIYCGSILPGVKARVVDYAGDEIPDKAPQIGQLILQGGHILANYIDDKDATKMQIRGTSFFTGDWVEITKDNKLRYIDRRDNIIKAGPNIITPENVEKVLSRIPEVERVTAIELKDQMNKQRCVAVIQKKPKVNLTAPDVINYVEEKMPKGEGPDRVAFIEEFPVDESGAINKYKLRKDLNGLV